MEERIVDLWAGRRQAWDEIRKIYEDRWIYNWQLYRNTRQTRRFKLQPWQSNAQIPDAFRTIETMVPQHVMGMFRNPNWFSVEAPTAAGHTYRLMAKSLLLQGWRKANGYVKTIEGVKMGNILGHVCPKVIWRTEIGEREIQDVDFNFDPSGEPMDPQFVKRTIPDLVHNGPDIVYPDLFNLWQDPTGQNLGWIERIPSSLEHLKTANKQFGGALYKNLRKLESEVAMSSALGSNPTYGSEDTPPLAHTVDGIPEQYADDYVELWQCWGYVPPSVKRYDDTQWRLQIIANQNIVLRDEPAPTHDHRPPYYNVQAIPIPGQIYGDSVLSYIGDLIELRSEIENRRRDEVLLNIHGTYWVDGRFQLRGQDMLKTPGGAVRVTPTDPSLNLDRAIGMFPRSPVLSDAYTESSVKERQIEQATGAFAPFQGDAFGGRTTAREVGLIQNVGTARFQMATMWLDETLKKPALERMFKLYQAKLTTPEMVSLVGQPEIKGEVDFTDLRYDVDIFVDSGLFGSMDSTEMANIMNVYSTLLANPATHAYIDIGKLVSALNYRSGLASGSDNFVRSDEEAAQIQQAQAQQALQEAALGGSAAAGRGSPQGAPRK